MTRAKVSEEERIEAAVREYLDGKDPLQKISAKHGLRGTFQLREWIKAYNSGRDFGHKMSGGSRMKQGRETTQEERIAIVNHRCQLRKILYYFIVLLTGCSSNTGAGSYLRFYADPQATDNNNTHPTCIFGADMV